MLAGACRTWFDTARRLVDIDWYRYNTGRDTRLINGCGPTPERVRGSKGRNAQRRGFLSEDSCRSSERVSATMASLGKAGREWWSGFRESVGVERLEFVGAVRVGVESESCWSDWSQTIVVSASVRVVYVVIRSLYFSCDLLIVLLSFSLLPIHFYSDERVDFRSLTTKQDSFPTGGIRT